MNKKEYLELLIKSYGLTPKEITAYRTDGAGGQYKVTTGWRGKGVDGNQTVIAFEEPEGFNMAIYEILEQANDMELKPKFVDNINN